MDEKSPGQLLFELIPNKFQWDSLLPLEKETWNFRATRFSAPLLKRIEELEKELAGWRYRATERQRMDAQCRPADLDPPRLNRTRSEYE